jgi:effector-binding domain-containing protein
MERLTRRQFVRYACAAAMTALFLLSPRQNALSSTVIKGSDTTPTLQHRGRKPYLSIRTQTTINALGSAIGPLLGEVFGWMKTHHIRQAGAPFVRYDVVDMAHSLEVEVGIPTDAAARGAGRIHSGAFPAGKYAVMVHTGPYSELAKANADLQAWAKEHGLQWKSHPSPAGDVWEGRVEFYVTDPQVQPDPHQWKTEIAYLVADPLPK